MPKKESCQDYYVDQSPANGPNCWGSLSEQNLKDIDKDFCDKICNMTTMRQADRIARDIEDNEHLHEKIKENLLYNLEKYRKALPPSCETEEIEDEPVCGCIITDLIPF